MSLDELVGVAFLIAFAGVLVVYFSQVKLNQTASSAAGEDSMCHGKPVECKDRGAGGIRVGLEAGEGLSFGA